MSAQNRKPLPLSELSNRGLGDYSREITALCKDADRWCELEWSEEQHEEAERKIEEMTKALSAECAKRGLEFDTDTDFVVRRVTVEEF